MSGFKKFLLRGNLVELAVAFLNALISFLILAAVIYFLVVVPFSKLLERFKPSPDAPAPTQDCPHCLSAIPAAASVCAFCARDVAPVL